MNLKSNIIRGGIVAAALFLSIGIFGSASANAQGGNVLKEVLDRMDANYKTLTTFRSNVSMVKFNEQIGSRDMTEGTTSYISKNGRKKMYIRIDWTKPQDESIVVIGDEYQLYRPKLGQAIRGNTKSAKNSGAAGGAFAFMSMSKAELQSNYVVQYAGQEGVTGAVQTWHLVMTPKTKTSYKSADLWVDSNGMPLQVKITELNDDTTTVVLSKIEKNADIKESQFNMKLPANTQIIPG